MSWVSGDRWTCPVCGETVVGRSRHRRVQRRIHGRRHGVLTDEAATADERLDDVLTIPPAPKGRRRGPRPRR